MKLTLVCAFVLLGIVGCGSGGGGQKYAKVTGTVTFDGKPLEDAKIRFTQPGLPPTSMDVVDGKFSGQAIVGNNIVSLTAMRKSAKARPLPPGAIAQIKGYAAMNKGGVSEADTDPKVETIPDDWGANSTQERVVQDGGPNEFDFVIKKGK